MSEIGSEVTSLNTAGSGGEDNHAHVHCYNRREGEPLSGSSSSGSSSHRSVCGGGGGMHTHSLLEQMCV